MRERAWTTTNEIEFIWHLGKFAPHQKTTRTVLLKRYLKATRLRVDWDGLDRLKIVNEARRALWMLTGGEPCGF